MAHRNLGSKEHFFFVLGKRNKREKKGHAIHGISFDVNRPYTLHICYETITHIDFH